LPRKQNNANSGVEVTQGERYIFTLPIENISQLNSTFLG